MRRRSNGVTIEQFYESAKKHARLYNPYGVICQAIQETSTPGRGPFTSELASNYHNYGGIKCKRFWTLSGRDCVTIVSDEYINGVKKAISSQFRVYRSVDDYLECLNDKFIEPGTDYRVVVQNRDCFWLHFAGLYFGGWATDPNYFSALCKHAVALAPRLLGKEGHMKIRNAFAYALSKQILHQWMINAIKDALMKEGK